MYYDFKVTVVNRFQILVNELLTEFYEEEIVYF